MDDQLPLTALLSQALVAYTIECDNLGELRLPHRTAASGPAGKTRGPFLTSIAMWWNCLRYVSEAGIRVDELAAAVGTATNLAGMRRWGYLVLDPPPAGTAAVPKPDAVITLTRWGRHAAEVWAPIPAEIDARWAARFPQTPALRAALRPLLRPDLPVVLPVLHYGLFCRGIITPPTAAPFAGLPSADLPLGALMSQVLLRFALAYERRSGPVSLAVAADLLRVLDPDSPTLVRDLPARGGVSKEALSMASGVMAKREHIVVEPAAGRGKQVRLTESGVAARRAYAEILADLEARAPLPELRAALEAISAGLLDGIRPEPGNWRAKGRPPATLPHFPMVLHRGGYPDGS